LFEGADVCAGTSLEALLSREAARRISEQVRRLSERHAELVALLSQEGMDLSRARDRVSALESESSPLARRSMVTARLQLESTRRLHSLRARDERALTELADLVDALRTQLLLARYSGSSAEGVGGIVAEVWARVEGLEAAMDGTGEPWEREPMEPSMMGAD
jgi:hypothetical protein